MLQQFKWYSVLIYFFPPIKKKKPYFSMELWSFPAFVLKYDQRLPHA